MHDPRVPETLEGWWLLHQMFKVDWPAWQGLSQGERQQKAAEAAGELGGMGRAGEGVSAPCTLLGRGAADANLLETVPAATRIEARLACEARINDRRHGRDRQRRLRDVGR